MDELNDQAIERRAKASLQYSLEELLIGVTPDQAHESSAEVDWGPDVGQEILTD